MFRLALHMQSLLAQIEARNNNIFGDTVEADYAAHDIERLSGECLFIELLVDLDYIKDERELQLLDARTFTAPSACRIWKRIACSPVEVFAIHEHCRALLAKVTTTSANRFAHAVPTFTNEAF